MTPWFFLVIAFGTWKGKCTKILKKILRSGISEYLDKGIFTHRKCTSVEFTSFFSDDSFQSYYYIETLKRRGHRTIFHAKAFVSLAIPTHVLAHLKIRILKDAHDLLRLPLTIACARASSYCIRSQTFTNVYCSESHSAAVKDSPPGSPWKIYFQPLTILAIFLLKNNRRKFEMD